ncbi:hypothetical protein [Rivularia sp. UHCC 0363]|uniref:hypothetical protein n=1 Tax=Rivularia sp. UHCC 0363 TaxID=3110244 RepID=UPI002B2008B5|nr:hypothetical protein [Rivularia sp. UHCC 0363]MEA5593207.1 hypothetical protein [Rivularia sp. UHCC 0363]
MTDNADSRATFRRANIVLISAKTNRFGNVKSTIDSQNLCKTIIAASLISI